MRLLNILIFAGLLTSANADITKHSENIVKDTKTGFLWQNSKDAKTKKLNYNEANKYCKNLTLDGEKNWKVPGFGELFSIVDPKVYNPTLNIAFTNFVTDNYWSTKTFGHATSGEAFVVDFKSGAFNRKMMDEKFYVRCYKKAN